LRGFGLVGAVYLIEDSDFYISGGMFTPYSDDVDSTIDEFFEKNDYFYNLEFGFTSQGKSAVPLQSRGPMDANNIHISTWYRDPLEDGSPRAYGAAFNANYMVGDDIMWFLRGGWSDGAVIDKNLAAGLGFRPSSAPSDLFGIGVGWVQPSNDLLRDQYNAEVFYRFMVTEQFALTPDVQLIVNPSLNPSEDHLWALGLRGRLTF
jgi:porin